MQSVSKQGGYLLVAAFLVSYALVLCGGNEDYDRKVHVGHKERVEEAARNGDRQRNIHAGHNERVVDGDHRNIQAGHKERVLEARAQGLFPAMFIFGDSLVDNGNNNFLTSLARADFPPNGIDFGSGWPTGRFCNGRTITDYIGILVGIDPVPAYLGMLQATGIEGLEQGANFASGAAGILDDSGYNYLGRIPMSQQLGYFASLKDDLVSRRGEYNTKIFLHKSLFIVVLGSNDYLNNYFLPDSAARRVYSPQAYQDLVLSTFSQQIQAMYNIGARKVVVSGIGPLGCIPNELFVFKSPDGSCIENPVNKLVRGFNSALQHSLKDLSKKHKGLHLLYGETYMKLMKYTQNATVYGFSVANTSCCGQGQYGAEVPCIPTSPFCSDRSSYVFWDRHHPTDRANLLLSTDFVSGRLEDISPMNILQLAAT